MDSIKFDFDGKVLYSEGESRSIADILGHTGEVSYNYYKRDLEVLLSTDSEGMSSYTVRTPLGTRIYGYIPFITSKKHLAKKPGYVKSRSDTRYLKSRFNDAHGYPKIKLTMEDRNGGEHVIEASLHYSSLRNRIVISAVYDGRQNVRVDTDGNYTFRYLRTMFSTEKKVITKKRIIQIL